MSEWQTRLPCFSPNFHEHTVNGQSIRFYPVSLGMAFKLKTIGRPLAKSLATLFGSKDQDHGTKDLEVNNPDGTKDRQVMIEPISEGLAKIRHEQRVNAIEGIVDAVTDDKNVEVIGDIIMDSLADIFPKSDRKSWPPAREFMNSMPLPVFGGMVMGVIMANKEVFGPLTDRVVAAAGEAVARVGAKQTGENPIPFSSPQPTNG